MAPKDLARLFAKELGYTNIKFKYGPEGVAFNPERKLAIFTFPGRNIDYPALSHELGHLYLGTKLPILTAISDVGTALESLSPFVASAYLLTKARNFRLRNILTALALWKIPTLPRLGEELAATLLGKHIAKKYNFPVTDRILRSNLPYLLTYM